MGRPAVQFANFGYTYPGAGAPSLTGVDLAIDAGSFVLVAGPSGGGKSTLCRAIVGLVPHLLGGTTAGSVTTLDVDVLSVAPHQLAGRVGYVFQNPEDQLVAQRVEHDVAFGPQNLGLPRAEIRARVDEALERAGIAELRRRLVDTLSAGQQQRVAVAGALALRPNLLILDEPTSQLDPANAKRLLELVAALHRDIGMTVVIAEHRIEWCLPYADRLVLVEAGRVSDGSVRGLLGRPGPLPAYLNVPAVVQVSRDLAWSAGIALSVEDLVTSARTSNGDTAGSQGDGAKGKCRHLNFAPGQSPDPAGRVAESVARVHPSSGGVSTWRSNVPEPPAEVFAASSGNTRPPLIELASLTFRYPNGVEALREVTLAVSAGEVVGLLGVSGSGKTTLVKHLNGLLRPSSGEVRLEGANTARLPVSTLARRVGFVFQNPLHQLFADSVFEEVALGPRAAGVAAAALTDRVNETLDRLGIRRLADRHPLSLSEGERRRVAIAAALATNPNVLVMDEPTLGQDAAERSRLAALCAELRSAGTAVVLVTHEVEFAVDVCDRLAVLDAGRLVACGPARTIGLDPDVLEPAGLLAPQIVEVARRLNHAGYCIATPTIASVVGALQGACVHPVPAE